MIKEARPELSVREPPAALPLVARPAGRARAVAAWTGVLLAALFAPLLGRGTVLLLDYGDVPIGPHATLGANTWGFPPDLTSRVPITTALLLLFRAVPFEQVKLLPLVAYVPIAAFGFYRLLGRRALPTVAATTLFVVNPFTYDRAFAGQVYFLLGYALLPFVLELATTPSTKRGIWLGLVVALQAALSIHFVFITTILLMLAVCLGPGTLRQRAQMLLAAGVSAVLASAYWLIPIASAGGELARVTLHDVAIFRTRGDPAFGLVPNLLGLYGFWREPWALKRAVPAWPLFALSILAIAAVGVRAAREERARRRVAVVAAAIGLVLACGAAGPLGSVFVSAFEHVPGFPIMREPQKFLCLYALGLAWGFGLGVERLVQQTRSRMPRRALAAALVAVPLAATFPMLWGFWGSVRPSIYPASWTAADRIMGSGPGRVLAVPGDAYLSFPWTQDRSVANPMASFFARTVLTDGNLELGGLESQTSDATSRYLGYVTSVGSRTTRFGNLVAPLGVRYVLLSRTEDWARYSWLFRQADLRVVHRWPDLVLFENEEPAPPAYQPRSTITLRDWGQVVGLAGSTRLTDLAIRVDHAAPGPIRVPLVSPPPPVAPPPAVIDRTTSVTVGASDPTAPLVVARPYDDRWSSSSGPVQANLGIDLLIASPGPGVTSLRFGGWPPARAGYLCSVLALLASCVVALTRWARRRTSSTRLRPYGASRASTSAATCARPTAHP
jgi:hypothetical protein